MPEEIPFFIRGAGGPQDPDSPRVPIEMPEGVSGQFIESGESIVPVKRAVSLTHIRTLDLICEGEIDGLTSGEYTYVGVPGEIGYRNVTFKPYNTKSVNGIPIPYLRSIYWNETPVVDKDNLFNFQQIDVTYSNGGPNGSSAVGIGDELTISRNIQERLRGPNSVLDKKNKQQIIGEVEQFAKYYRILNKNCLAVNINVRVNALSKTVVSGSKAGDTLGANVFYRIYYKPLFNKAGSISSENVGPEEQEGYIFAKEEEIAGKISFGYIRSSRVNFDSALSSSPGFVGWAIKIFRLTPDALQGSLRNQTYVDSLTEIYGNAFCYPNSAIISQKFSAEYFSQIPARAFDARLLRVKIPSNYDPIKKTYEGEWNGSWKTDIQGNESKFWTDNPAWCFYDIITNSRYGLGKYIDPDLIDKWTLYEIGQYCDTLVPDGFGGIEPRFSCNMILTTREDAYKVVNDMASIFRAIVYYFAGGIYSSMDSRKAEIYQFTNASVEEGNFNYSSSSKRVRHSVAIVRYNDKFNFYQPAIEYVEDAEAIKKYGYKELEVAAFGCTSRGQAIRYGRWALLSETLETETVSFQAGIESTYLRPGDVFKIFDRNKKNTRHGGRIASIRGNSKNSTIVLDDYITGFRDSAVYNLSIITPTYNYEPSTVSNLSSSDASNIRRRQIQNVVFSGGNAYNVSGLTAIDIDASKFGSSLDFENYSISNNLIWTIEASGTNPQDANFTNQWEYYRVIRVEEKDVNVYSINGLQYEEQKYEAIDSGLNFQGITPQVDIPSAPDSLTLTFGATPGSNDLKSVKYVIAKNNLIGVDGFLVYAKLGDWEPLDFSERFTDGSPMSVVSQTPDNKYLINIVSNSTPQGYYIPLENGKYYFRAYSRNILGIPSDSSVSNNITINNLNTFQSLVLSSLRLEGSQDVYLAHRTGELYSTSNPTFRWQSSFENYSESYNVGDLFYRVTIRKSTSPDAINKASPSETPYPGDPFQPSNIIYYESRNYKPEDSNNPSFSFDLESNISSIVNYYKQNNSGFTGILREYDVVVEAHLSDGQSSAGGNIDGTRQSINDSAFSPIRSKGWDILYVNNPKIPSLTLTENDGLAACLLNSSSNPNLICTEQWINSDGTINLKFHTNNLPEDVAGGFVFSCREFFTQAEANNGKKNNGIKIHKSEFSEISDPIVASSDLLGYRSGWMSLSLYDTFDKAFRDEMTVSDASFNTVFISGLNMSNAVVAKSRGVAEAQGRFTAWVNFNLSALPNDSTQDSRLKIENLKWFGAGALTCQIDGFDFRQNTSVRPTNIYVKVVFDSELIKETDNVAKVVSYIYGTTPLNSSNSTVGNIRISGNQPLIINEGQLPNGILAKEYGLGQNVSIKSTTNQEAIFRIAIPHDYSYENTNPGSRLERVKTEAAVFIGLLANSEGLNITPIDDYQSV